MPRLCNLSVRSLAVDRGANLLRRAGRSPTQAVARPDLLAPELGGWAAAAISRGLVTPNGPWPSRSGGIRAEGIAPRRLHRRGLYIGQMVVQVGRIGASALARLCTQGPLLSAFSLPMLRRGRRRRVHGRPHLSTLSWPRRRVCAPGLRLARHSGRRSNRAGTFIWPGRTPSRRNRCWQLPLPAGWLHGCARCRA